MQYINAHNINQVQAQTQNKFTAVAIGNFDGVHLGHQKLIETIKKYSEEKGLSSVVFSFYPHPITVLRGCGQPFYIMSSIEKRNHLADMDVDVFLEYPFTKEFAVVKSRYFVEEILYKQLKCRILVVGEDYRFGENRVGSFELLKELGGELGIQVIGVSKVFHNDVRVSSSKIRQCILNRDIELANEFLNYPYFVYGEVVHGKDLGKVLGFPTINLLPNKDKLLPPNGVYITKTLLRGNVYDGITNIGVAPTFEPSQKVVETNLFDFSGDAYSEFVKVSFYKWVRDEKKFNSKQELIEQMKKDSDFAREAIKLACFRK